MKILISISGTFFVVDGVLNLILGVVGSDLSSLSVRQVGLGFSFSDVRKFDAPAYTLCLRAWPNIHS